MRRVAFLCLIAAGFIMAGCVGDRALGPETVDSTPESISLDKSFFDTDRDDILGETLAIDPDSLQPINTPNEEG